MRVKNLVGEEFGYLKVGNRIIKKYPSGGSYSSYTCICNCGKIIEVSYGHLTSGHTKSCGCQKGLMCSKIHFEDITGQIFNRLTVINLIGKNKRGEHVWNCKCTCGNFTKVTISKLKSSNTKSCGCLHRETSSRIYKEITSKQRGSNHPHYNPLLTTKDRKYRRSEGFWEWSRNVKVRDKYTCQRCGKNRIEVHSHHLNSYHDNKDIKNDINNGVTLCTGCHNKFHRIYGYSCNRDKYINFKNSFNNQLELNF